jgi:hypothetical protein
MKASHLELLTLITGRLFTRDFDRLEKVASALLGKECDDFRNVLIDTKFRGKLSKKYQDLYDVYARNKDVWFTEKNFDPQVTESLVTDLVGRRENDLSAVV